MGGLQIGSVPEARALSSFRNLGPHVEPKITVENFHGVKVSDPYHYLWIDRAAAEDYLTSFARNSRAALDALPARERIFQKVNKPSEFRTELPISSGDRIFEIHENTQTRSKFVVMKNRDQGAPQIVLDSRKEFPDGSHEIDYVYPSRDGRYLAWVSSPKGTKKGVLRVRDIAPPDGSPAKDLDFAIPGSAFSVVTFHPTNGDMYYTQFPKEAGDSVVMRSVRVRNLNTGQDDLVFRSKVNPADYPSPILTADGRWLVITNFNSRRDTEVLVRDLEKPGTGFVQIAGYNRGVSVPAYSNGRMFLLTNENAPRRKIVEVPLSIVSQLAAPQDVEIVRNKALLSTPEIGTVIVPESESVLERSFGTTGKHLIVQSKRNRFSDLALVDPSTGRSHALTFPLDGTVSGISTDSRTGNISVWYSSFGYPPRELKFDASGKDITAVSLSEKTKKSQEVEVLQIEYPSTSPDGTVTRVPMTIVKKKSTKLDGKNPVLLECYGGFGLQIAATYRSRDEHWLEEGGILAIPGLRGGGELGEGWHREGVRDKKHNTIQDVFSAVEFLVTKKYASPSKIVIQGASEGGRVALAAATERPELFAGVVASSAPLDLLHFHDKSSGVSFLAEYGDPRVANDFQFLKENSTYHRLLADLGNKDTSRHRTLPPMLLSASGKDSVVYVSHTAKFAAAATAHSPSTPIFMLYEPTLGHQSPSTPQFQADVLGFMFEAVKGSLSREKLKDVAR